MKNPGALAEFLRAKRAEVSPEDTPLASYGGRRRVRGLRREEIAQLAGVSVGYYTRLEQGHSRHASDEVLLSIANALKLRVTETEHLLDLSRAKTPGDELPAGVPEVAEPRALAMLDFIMDRPAVLLGRRNDVLAWNRLGHALVAPFLPFNAPRVPPSRPSLPKLLFLEPMMRELFVDWEAEAADYVAYLKMVSGKYPNDTALTALVGELLRKDRSFADFWASGRIEECIAGTKRMCHPTAGELVIDFQLWAQSSFPEHRLEVYDYAEAQRINKLLRTVPETGLVGPANQSRNENPGSTRSIERGARGSASKSG